MKKKIALIITFVMFVVSVFSGCSSSDENVENTDNTTNTEAQTNTENYEKGNEIVLSMRTTQNLNPLTNEDESVDNILKIMFEPLIAIDSTGKPQPAVAESWTYSEDGSVLSIKIKDNLYWHNGSKITADDVVFSINTIKGASENSVYKNCVSNIASCTKTGELTVNINFTGLYSGNIYYLTFPIISSAYYGSGNMADKNLTPLGNSAYAFKSFTPAKELRLVKSDNSFGKAAATDEICVNITPDKDTDLYSFDQGILDVIAADVTEMGKYDSTGDRQISEYSTNYIDYIGFNWNRSIFQDKNVRKAIAFAVPKESILESVYLSHGQVANTIVNPSSWLYEDEVEKYEYNLDESKTLLNDSGWIDSDGDNVRDKTTNELKEVLKFNILVNEENEERKQIAVRLCEEFRAIGISATVEAVPFTDYQERLLNNDFDMYVGGIKQNVVPDFTYLLGTGGSMNYTGYSSEQTDLFLHSCRSALTDETMKTSFSSLQKYVAEEVVYIPVAYRNSAIFANRRVNGELSATEINVFQNAYKWYIKK